MYRLTDKDSVELSRVRLHLRISGWKENEEENVRNLLKTLSSAQE